MKHSTNSTAAKRNNTEPKARKESVKALSPQEKEKLNALNKGVEVLITLTEGDKYDAVNVQTANGGLLAFNGRSLWFQETKGKMSRVAVEEILNGKRPKDFLSAGEEIRGTFALKESEKGYVYADINVGETSLMCFTGNRLWFPVLGENGHKSVKIDRLDNELLTFLRKVSATKKTTTTEGRRAANRGGKAATTATKTLLGSKAPEKTTRAADKSAKPTLMATLLGSKAPEKTTRAAKKSAEPTSVKTLLGSKAPKKTTKTGSRKTAAAKTNELDELRKQFAELAKQVAAFGNLIAAK